MISTLSTLCSQRTTRKFQHDVLSKQSRGFSKGQEVTANVEHPFVAGHLQRSVSIGNWGWGMTQTFHLVHFV